MKRNALFLMSAWVAGFVAFAVAPALAQPGRRATEVIALQVNVEDLASGQRTTYGLRPNTENIPLAPGQRVRVSLVGTAIVNGVGVERPINARFSATSGNSSLELGQSGNNWIMVRGRGYGGNGLAQLGYDVTDRNYAMRGAFDSGRITFQMAGGTGPGGPGGPAGPGPGPRGPGGDRRFEAAERITRTLYRAILRQDDLGRRAQEDVEAIDRGGYSEIQRVARNLATQVEANRGYDSREAPEVAARLYRELLHREGGPRQIGEQDRGFWDNVRLLRERGMVELVRTIVGSQEFQRVQDLDRDGLLYGHRDRDRYRH
jgi:hypothetical protein